MYGTHSYIKVWALLALLFPIFCWAQVPADTAKAKIEGFSKSKGNAVSVKADSAKVGAATDTLPVAGTQVAKADTIIIQPKKHSPKRATIMSALLPGLGQVYNRHWWKVPIIYGGLGGCIYGIAFNQKYLNDFRSAYKIRLTQPPGSDPYWGKYTDANLVTLQDYYKRNRDLCYIIMAGVYVLNILDASVSAHLFDFDVSDDLSMRWQPGILTAGRGQTVPGLSLSLRFK